MSGPRAGCQAQVISVNSSVSAGPTLTRLAALIMTLGWLCGQASSLLCGSGSRSLLPACPGPCSCDTGPALLSPVFPEPQVWPLTLSLEQGALKLPPPSLMSPLYLLLFLESP